MAVVGEAHILVKAITTGVKRDIERGFNGVDRSGDKIGKSLGSKFSKAFRSTQGGMFKKLGGGLKGIEKDSIQLSDAWTKLQRSGFVLQTAVGVLAGSLGAVVGGLGAVIGSAGGAASAGVALVGTFINLKVAAMAAKFALSGIGAAVSALWKQQGKSDKANKTAARAIRDARRALAKVIAENAEQLIDANKRIEKSQRDLNKAFEEAQEQVQQLGFDAEDAALNEKKAALELEKARETLVRVQDLPPNSRARREAELAFQEAELNYRRAVDQNADLAKEQQKIAGDPKNTEGYINAAQEVLDAEENKTKVIVEGIQQEEEARERLADAIADAADKASSSDPLAGLTESQRKFALYLASLKPLLDGLKENVAKGFLPELQTQMERIINSDAMGVIERGSIAIGKALGTAAKNFTDEFLKPSNIQALDKVLGTTAFTAEHFGTIAGKAFGSLLKILEAADPIIRKFVLFIEKKATIFDNFLEEKKKTKELEAFFNRAGEIAGQFGDIFGNIFGTLGNIIMANFQPGSGGDMMLQYLQKATQAWNDFGKTPEGALALQEFFKGAADNLKSMLDVLGPFVLGIIKLGADKNIKIFWDTMKEGVPYLLDIMKAGLDAGPSLARLLVALTKITAALADSGSIKIFFDTLTFFADGIASILENETVKAIINTISQVGAFVSALALVGVMAMKIGGVIVGLASKFGAIFGVGAGPILGIFAIAAALIYLYQTNEEFRKSVEDMVMALMPSITALGQAFSSAFTALGPILADIVNHVADLVIALMPLVTSILKTAIDLFTAIVTPLLQFLPVIARVAEVIVGSLVGALISIIDPVTKIVDLIGGTLVKAIDMLLPPIMLLIESMITGLLPVFTSLIEQGGKLITEILEALIPIFNEIMEVVLDVIPVLVEELLPAIMGIMTAVVPVVASLVEALVPAILAIVDAVLPLVTMLLDMLMPVFTMIIKTVVTLAAQIFENLVPIITMLADALVPVIKFVADLVAGIVKFLMPILKLLIGIFAAVVAVLANVLVPIIATVISAFTGGWSDIGKHFKIAINNMIGLVEGFVNGFIDGVNDIIKAINKIKFNVPDWVPLIGGKQFGFNIGTVGKIRIPRLAEGGTVMPSNGGTLAQIAEAGRPERVEPLDPNGLSKRDKAMIELLAGGSSSSGSPIQIIVNPAPGMNERELATAVSRQLALQMRKGSIA